jgi:VanZ family protein
MRSVRVVTKQPLGRSKIIVQAGLRWLAVVLWMGAIFVLSDFPSLKSPFEPLHDFILRKLAHVTEYGILTALLVSALRFHIKRNAHALIMAALIAVLYAFSDEWHQTFVPGREGSLFDVGIDGLGVGVSLWFAREKSL